MKCTSCGREIPVGNVYCPICGKEAQIISDKSVLEEDLLKILLEDDSISPEEYHSQEQLEAKKERDRQLQKKKKLELQRKKRKKKILIIILIIVICIVAAGIFLFVKKSNSYEAIYDKAKVAYHTAKYDEALELTVKALDKQPGSVDAYILLGDIYVQKQDFSMAENSYLKVIERDSSNYDAFEKLLKLYHDSGNYDAIQTLAAATTDADNTLQKLFDSYLVDVPVINIPGGEYKEPLKLEFTIKRGLHVYYTLDGSAPTLESTLYEKLFEIEEEGTTTLQAISVDENGNISEILRVEYTLAFETPDKPRANPDGGNFTEPTKIKLTSQSGTTIYYTWDSTMPDKNSSVYSEPIEVPEGNSILTAVAISDSTKKKSDVMKANFIYYPTTTEDTPVLEE